MAADLVAASTAVASGGITEAGVELAGVAVTAGAGMAGAILAGAGLIPVGVGELASAVVGAGATRMRMAIPTIITPIIRITHTTGRTLRQWTGIGMTVTTKIRVRIRRSEIQSRRDLLAQATRSRR